MNFYVYDMEGNRTTTLSGDAIGSHTSIVEAKVEEKLNTYDQLFLTYMANTSDYEKIKEGYNVVFEDVKGWKEYTIGRVVDEDNEGVFRELISNISSVELEDEIILSDITGRYKLDRLMEEILQNTRFDVGHVDNLTEQTISFDTQYRTVAEVMEDISELYGVEFVSSYLMDSTRISRRLIDTYKQYGDSGGKVFELDKDVQDVKRTVETEGVKTSILPLGKEPTEEGEERLTIKDISWNEGNDPADKPSGQLHLTNYKALAEFGYGSKDSKRPKIYAEEFDVETAEELIKEGWERLQELVVPNITYEATVHDLYTLSGKSEEFEHEKVGLGDVVAIRDFNFYTPMLVRNRITEMERDLLVPINNVITLGEGLHKFRSSEKILEVSSQVKEQSDRINTIQDSANGKNKTFTGPSDPTDFADVSNGDTWFKEVEDGETEIYTFTDGEWEFVLSTADTTVNADKVDEALKEIEDARQEANDAVDKIENDIEGKFTDVDDELGNIKDRAEETKNRANDAYDRAKNALSEAERAIGYTEEDYVAIKALEDVYDDLTDEVSDFKLDIDGFEQVINDYEGQVSEFVNDIDGFRNTIVEYEDELDEYGDKVGSYATQVSEFENTIDGFRSDVSRYEDTIDGFVSQVSSLENSIDGFRSQVEKVEAEIVDIDESISEVDLRDKDVKTGNPIYTDKADDESVVHVEMDGKTVHQVPVGEGRNLRLNSIGKNISDYPKIYRTKADKEIKESDSVPSGYYMRLDNLEEDGTTPNFYVGPNNSSQFSTKLEGKRIMVSMYLRGNKEFNFDDRVTVGTDWTRVSFIRTFGSSNFHFYINGDVTQVDISSMKFEESDTATPYSPAPEDIENNLQSVNNVDIVSQRIDIDGNERDNIYLITGRNLLRREVMSSRLSHDEDVGRFTINTWAGNYINTKKFGEVLEPNTEYTASLEVELKKIPSKGEHYSYYAGFLLRDNNNQPETSVNLRTSSLRSVGDKKKIIRTFKTTDVIDNYTLYAYSLRNVEPVTTGEVEVTNFKIEKGDTATPWTPAPEDVPYDTLENNLYKTKLELEEPLRSVGDVKDRLFRDEDSLWEIERNVGKRQADGEEFDETYELEEPHTETLPQDLQNKLNNIASFAKGNSLYTILPDNSDILQSKLQPELHATFKSKGWYRNFKTGERISTNTTSIEQNAEQIELKASRTAVDAIENRVDTAESTIKQNANEIELKASSSEVDTLKGRVTENESSIGVLDNEISLKVSQSDYDDGYEELEDSIDYVESEWKQRADSIEGTVSSVDGRVTNVRQDLDSITSVVDDNEGKISVLQQNVNGLQSTVSDKASQSEVTQLSSGLQSVVKDLDDLEIGGRNLLIGSKEERKERYSMGSWYLAEGVEPKNGDVYTISFKVARGSDYLDQYSVYNTEGSQGADFQLVSPAESQSVPIEEYTWVYNTFEWKAADLSDNDRIRIYVGDIDDDREYRSYIKEVKLEKGNKATDWSPAPEDTESKVTQLSDSINLRVKKGDVVTQLNIEAGRTLIDSDKLLINSSTVAISGTAFIDGAVIKNASMDGAKIADATISHGKIASLDANKITTGTLEGIRIIAEKGEIANFNMNKNYISSEVDGRYTLFKGGGAVAFATGSPQDVHTENAQLQITHSGVIRWKDSINRLYLGENDHMRFRVANYLYLYLGRSMFVDGRILPYESRRDSLGAPGNRWKAIYLDSGGVYESSDIRLKKKPRKIKDYLIDSMGDLKPIEFEELDGKTSYGYSAQEYQAILHKYATNVLGLDGEKDVMNQFNSLDIDESYLSMNYKEVEVLKGAYRDKRIEELENRIKELENAS